MASVLDRFNQKIATKVQFGPHGDCWKWLGTTDGRYGLLHVDGKMEKAHRVSYMLNVGEISDGMCILHSCDTPLCVNYFHLSQGTHAENMRQAGERGRMSGKQSGDDHWTRKRPELVSRGEAAAAAKFSDETVAEIFTDPCSVPEAVKKYGCSKSQVIRIRKRESRTDATDNLERP